LPWRSPRPRARPNRSAEIAAGLTDEKSAQFHEKWVVGYGHASVAEHAVLHLAIETPRAWPWKPSSPTGWPPTREIHPLSEMGRGCLPRSRRTGRAPLRDEYVAHLPYAVREPTRAALEPVRAVVQKAVPQREGEKDEAWDRRIRSQYVDVCRFLLPAAALANVGVTANGRVLENAIRKWRSSPLAEVREIGAKRSKTWRRARSQPW